MIRFFDLKIPLKAESNLPDLITLAAGELQIAEDRLTACRLMKRSLDARSKQVKVNLRYCAFVDELPPEEQAAFNLKKLEKDRTVHIIGSGPAGLFAALQAIELGLKPIVFERGKNLRARRRDLANINKKQLVNPESNYCFGEGGAGTYSDGKLYTRSKKRGDVKKVLRALVDFGAKEDILFEAHPHIGTNKLPQIIGAIRETILTAGGEIHFQSKLTNVRIEKGRVSCIEINHEKEYAINELILATGHSARDIFYLFNKLGVALEAKSFAMGLRVEHPQELINRIQYSGAQCNELLPPATYQLVAQVNQKGVYSFCMCPGGIIAPCATAPGEVVTNGWSPSRRNNPYANSGIVVSLNPEDWKEHTGSDSLSGLNFQIQLERAAFQSANPSNDKDLGQKAPAQRLLDFVHGRPSVDLPKCSYQPGIEPVRLDLLLPPIISKRLQTAFLEFGKKMKGYLTNQAVLVGVESRTSSPVRFPRAKEGMHHLEIKNLYPVGEGAGYAGGIVSAAVDGMNAIQAISKANGLEIETKLRPLP